MIYAVPAMSIIKSLCHPHLPGVVTPPVKRPKTNVLNQNVNCQIICHILCCMNLCFYMISLPPGISMSMNFCCTGKLKIQIDVVLFHVRRLVIT